MKIISIIFPVLLGAQPLVTAMNTQEPVAKNEAEGADAPDSVAQDELIVNVLKEGKISVAGKEMNDEDFSKMLKTYATENPKKPVRIRGSKETKYHHVVHVLDLCRKAGISDVSFDTAS